jgi:hypothetical protein
MGENKTQPTSAPVEAYLDGIANERRRSDAKELASLMTRATGSVATMWGPSIVGFGCHHYAYDSGREGDTVAVGFAARAQALVIYGLGTTGDIGDEPSHLSDLGRYTQSKGCTYVKRLADVDVQVLERLVAHAYGSRHNS